MAEFENLLPHFENAWHEYRQETLIQGKERRRKPGGGAVPTTLRTHEDRLLFILVYVKLYPLQTLVGFLFGMSQDRANDWIDRLSIVLKKALSFAGSQSPDWEPRKRSSSFAKQEAGASKTEFPSLSLGTSEKSAQILSDQQLNIN